MKKHYEIDKEMVYIPNGTDIPDQTSEGKEKNLVFIGSLYGPNIRAAQDLANISHLLPEYTIQILGACAKGVQTDSPNVQLIGAVTEEEKHNYFLNAYAFVNLVRTGSGTNLKNARAMAYGLPVIATKIGARGFNTCIQVQSPNDVPTALANLDWPAESKKNREYAESISWNVIGEAFRNLVNS
jgi:glycosyltransferase involved in cell wall biosynthesis